VRFLFKILPSAQAPGGLPFLYLLRGKDLNLGTLEILCDLTHDLFHVAFHGQGGSLDSGQ
jgi:hypothetical protein